MTETTALTTAQEALDFHSSGRPGKFEIAPTKPVTTQRDLSLAYSPGVAEPCKRIHEDPGLAYDYTIRGNLVAVISNGTAVLGLGNLGALASKPVMEGKAVLFKRFADVDSIDLEVSTEDVDEFVNCVRFLGPSFGGINLEDIKAPECFTVEARAPPGTAWASRCSTTISTAPRSSSMPPIMINGLAAGRQEDRWPVQVWSPQRGRRGRHRLCLRPAGGAWG